jgi:hypothetical protein
MEQITSSRSTMIAIGAAVLTIVGAFLAWASILGISASGWDGGDGKLTSLAAVALVAVAFALKDRARQISMIVAAGLILLIGIINYFDISGDDLNVGVGLWLTLVGGAAGLAAAFVKD